MSVNKPVSNRKLLVAIDGSPHSRNSLHYLTGLFAGQSNVHFHLLSLVTGVSLPPGSEWLSEAERLNLIKPESRKRLMVHQDYLQSSVDYLVKRGVALDRIEHEVQICHDSPADDLAHQARLGLYDAVVLGRRGMSKLEELLLGSVSTNLLKKCHTVPQWIIDGKIDSQRFLVPVDGSPYALLAVDHLAFILRDHPKAEITFFHSKAILAKQARFQPEDCHRHWGEAWCAEHLRADNIFHAPRQLLAESNFPAARVHELETAKGFEPSRQIIRQALIDGYGTIVLGRRGPDAPKGFFRGVSDQVLLMAEQVAVWVVG